MILEEIKQEHLDELIEIVNNTWNFEKYGIEPTENKEFSCLDLYDCLTRSNFNKVAIEDGKVAGFLLGRDFSKPKDKNWQYLKKEAKIIRERLKQSKNYPLFKDYEATYKEVNKSLKEGVKKDFESELVLFAVNSKFKGKGIGKALLTAFETYLQENNICSLSLFTDTNCDYQFYDNNGFDRLGMLKRNPKLRNCVDMEFYIYDRKL